MDAKSARGRLVRKLDEVEGFLLLDLPGRALEILQDHTEWPGLQFEASFLLGEAHRRLGNLREALVALERAAVLRQDEVAVAIALGWCYKRTHRLAQAIDALDRTVQAHPEEPLLHYNLACYWTLAGEAERAIKQLQSAIALDPTLLRLVTGEPDFDALRDEPGFQRLLDQEIPSA